MSVIVKTIQVNIQWSVRAVEEILSICNYTEIDGKIASLTDDMRLHVKQLSETLNSEGMRVIAVAYKKIDQQIIKSTPYKMKMI